MTREELARFFRRRQRPGYTFVLLVFLLYFIGFALAMTGRLEKINPRWSADSAVPTLTLIAMVVGGVVGMTTAVAVPKCPHCKMRLTAYLLHIAIASGNCGYCGKSLEDKPLSDR